MSEFRAEAEGVVVVCGGCNQRNRVPYDRIKEAAECGQCSRTLPSVNGPLIPLGVSAFEAIRNQSTLPVLVDFWAGWCAPCRMVAPQVERVALLEAGKALVVKVDITGMPLVAANFSIQSVPTFVVLSGGKEVGRASGALPAAALQRLVRSATTGTAAG